MSSVARLQSYLKIWKVTYTTDYKHFDFKIIRARTYTEALCQFVGEYPTLIYSNVEELG